MHQLLPRNYTVFRPKKQQEFGRIKRKMKNDRTVEIHQQQLIRLMRSLK